MIGDEGNREDGRPRLDAFDRRANISTEFLVDGCCFVTPVICGHIRGIYEDGSHGGGPSEILTQMRIQLAFA